jgi:hypothetical protein
MRSKPTRRGAGRSVKFRPSRAGRGSSAPTPLTKLGAGTLLAGAGDTFSPVIVPAASPAPACARHLPHGLWQVELGHTSCASGSTATSYLPSWRKVLRGWHHTPTPRRCRCGGSRPSGAAHLNRRRVCECRGNRRPRCPAKRAHRIGCGSQATAMHAARPLWPCRHATLTKRTSRQTAWRGGGAELANKWDGSRSSSQKPNVAIFFHSARQTLISRCDSQGQRKVRLSRSAPRYARA